LTRPRTASTNPGSSRTRAPTRIPTLARMVPELGLATLDETERIEELMKASTRDLFLQFYNDVQTASSIRFIASVDRMLIEDGTYFVIEADGARESWRPARRRPEPRATESSR